MAFVKISKSGSGAWTVQLAVKQAGRTRILQHFGSAHTEAELQRLKALANQVKHQPAPGQGSLLVDHLDLDRVCVTTHTPHYLEQIIAHYYQLLGFGELGPPLLFDLVVVRLYHPCSKLRSLRILEAQFGRTYGVQSAYRLLRKLAGDPQPPCGTASSTLAPGDEHPPAVVVDKTANKADSSPSAPTLPPTTKNRLLQKLCTAHTAHYGSALSVVLYDVTTLYFESARDGDDYKVPGYSKDGKHKDPQILVGLLTNTEGFPLGWETFAGNTFEGNTLLTALDNWQRTFARSKLRVIADAGMLSKLNVASLVEHGYDFIVGARLKSLDAAMTKQLVALTQGKQKLADGASRNLTQDGHKLIIQYSAKRARKDIHTLDKAVKKAQAIVDGEQTLKRRSKFVVVDEPTKTAQSLNQVAIAQDKALAGLKGYLTNLRHVPEDEIIALYHELWHVEKSFRMSKHDLRARPIFHYKADSIKAHLLIVIMALAVAKLLEKDSGQSIQKTVDQLGSALSYTLEDSATGARRIQHPDTRYLDIPSELIALLE